VDDSAGDFMGHILQPVPPLGPRAIGSCPALVAFQLVFRKDLKSPFGLSLSKAGP
jgi:hypothetical protein